MDMRKRQATEAGYVIYRSRAPRPSLDEINETLQAGGHVGVSLRTYRHYRSLDNRGQQSYLPINEFDIAVKHHNLKAS